MILSQGEVRGRGKGPPLVRTLWSCLVLPRIQQLPRVPPNLDLPSSLDPLHLVLGNRSRARTTHKHGHLGQFTKQVEATTSRKPS